MKTKKKRCTGIFSKKKRNQSMRFRRAVSFNLTKWIVNTFDGVISDGYFPLNQTLLVSCVVYMCRPEFSVPMQHNEMKLLLNMKLRQDMLKIQANFLRWALDFFIFLKSRQTLTLIHRDA